MATQFGRTIGPETLNRAKTLGVIGSLLSLLIIVPSVGGILAIIGLILILFAVKDLSDGLNDRSIFSNMIWAIGLGILGIIVGVLVIFGTLFQFVGMNNLINAGTMPGTTPPVTIPPGDILGLVVGLIVGLVAIWAFYLVSAVFLKRSFDTISSRLNVNMFHTAALIYLIGAATTILVFGFALLFVAEILFLIAFISIPSSLTSQNQPLVT